MVKKRKRVKRISERRLTYDQLRRKGKIFGGKKYKYLCFIPDPQHQGIPGEIGRERKRLQASGYSVRTVRTPRGWKVYDRRPWYKL